MSVFDGAVSALMGTLGALTGYAATWTKDDNSTVNATVLYVDDYEMAKFGDKVTGTDKWTVEYQDTDFPGLRLLVQQRKSPKISVNVRGTVIDFLAMEAHPKVDGATIELKLKLKA